MKQLFNLDGPVMQALSKICDVFLLNLVFIICCLPVVTIGASLSALYSISIKMVRRTDTYVIKSFLQAFSANFKQSTLLWVGCILISLFLQYDYRLLYSQDTSLSGILRPVLFLIIVIFIVMFLYLFPVASHFECSALRVVSNAFLLSAIHFPFTIILLLYYIGIIFLMTRTPSALGLFSVIAVLGGFALNALSTSVIFNRIFLKYESSDK